MDQLNEQRRLVDIDHYDITVRELVRMATENELIRAPAYQRKFRWTEYDESRLIESIFLGLPVPTIFVATNLNGSWEIVDGLQRISTLMHFVASSEQILNLLGKKPLKLNKLEKLTDFNGKQFVDLTFPQQQLFYKRPVRITALNDKSDESVRFEMFDRLNRGGIALTAQEVRACIYRGEFSDFIKALSKEDSFTSLLKLQSSEENDGTKEELVLKFFAYLNSRSEFKQKVGEFLNRYMAEANKSFDYTTHRDLFLKSTGFLSRVCVGSAFLRTGVNVTPVNQFEAIIVAIAEIFKEGGCPLLPDHGWYDDITLVQFSTKGTNSKKSLNGRIQRAKQLFSGSKPELAE